MRLSALLAALWLSGAAPARADELRQVSLAEALAAAPPAPAAKAPRHDLAAAEALIDAAGAWPSPGLRLETNRLTARLVAGATLPLPVFGTVGAARREASAQAGVVRAEVSGHDHELRKRIVDAWLALARADGEATAAVAATAQAAELERIARGRLDAGAGAEVDVTTAHAAKIRADLAVAKAHKAQLAASAELAAILGWDPTHPLATTGDLPREVGPLDALRAHLGAHPDTAIANKKIAAANAAIGAARALRRPSLALETQVSFSDPETPGTDVQLALTIELPLFARAGDRVRAATATRAAETARLAATNAGLDGALVAAYRRWEAARDTLDTLIKDIVPAQERAATLASQAYKEGARDLAYAIQVDRDLAAVRAEVIDARVDLAAAWAAVQAAAGVLLEAPHAP